MGTGPIFLFLVLMIRANVDAAWFMPRMPPVPPILPPQHPMSYGSPFYNVHNTYYNRQPSFGENHANRLAKQQSDLAEKLEKARIQREQEAQDHADNMRRQSEQLQRQLERQAKEREEQMERQRLQQERLREQLERQAVEREEQLERQRLAREQQAAELERQLEHSAKHRIENHRLEGMINGFNRPVESMVNRPSPIVESLKQVNWNNVRQHATELLEAYNMKPEDIPIKIVENISDKTRNNIMTAINEAKILLERSLNDVEEIKETTKDELDKTENNNKIEERNKEEDKSKEELEKTDGNSKEENTEEGKEKKEENEEKSDTEDEDQSAQK